MQPKYFVTSNGDSPDAIFFSWDEARDTNADYIDAFDEHGKHLVAYKFVNGSYTQEF